MMLRVRETSCRQANAVEGGAAALSALCLVHCLALPLLLFLSPAIGLLAHSEWFHLAAVGLVIPAAGVAIELGYCQHGSAAPVILAAVGMMSLAIALLGGWSHTADTFIMAGGSVVLLLSHLVNWRLRARAR